jgi:DNA-binding NtrC family response regulator
MSRLRRSPVVKPTSDKILVVDDDEKILYAFRELLKKDGRRMIEARNGEEAISKASSEMPCVVFLDITMPKVNGLAALKEIKSRNPSIPVILITGYGSMQTAIAAMQAGAFEYLTKPLDLAKIRDVMHKALTSVQSPLLTSPIRSSFDADRVDRYEIIGNTLVMQEVYKLIGSVSTTPNHTSVLILGESGTGKELVARGIHANSRSSAEPFVAINCTALPESLLESELFGHEKGAFTGASHQKPGKFEMAGTGTIFLDEIGNLSIGLQQKLLRVLQERQFERLGGNEAIHVSARFIAATNRDILEEVKKGAFREDLLFRLNVVTIRLPPLRERMEDVPLLAEYFVAKYNDRLQKSIRGFTSTSMKRLQEYSYPGNVRELENLVERAVMITRGNVILPEAFMELSVGNGKDFQDSPSMIGGFSNARDVALRNFEKKFLVSQLKIHRGNVTEAARASKMTRQNFQRLMKKYGMHAKQFRE